MICTRLASRPALLIVKSSGRCVPPGWMGKLAQPSRKPRSCGKCFLPRKDKPQMNPQEPPENWSVEVTIRHLQRKDLPALEWDGQYSHFRRVYAEAFERALCGLSVLWVAELDSHGIIAQVFIQLNCRRPELADGDIRAYLYSFRVKPAFQCAGLGTRMLSVVEADLIFRGFKFVTLNVAKDNPAPDRCTNGLATE